MRVLLPFALVLAAATTALAQKVEVQWDKVERISRTTPTLQVVVNPPLRRGSAIHDRVFAELKELDASYVRYVPWLPYPRLGVAELEPPTKDKTSWDFSLIDPITIDFLEATKGRPAILNFSTIPAWMFKTVKPVAYPEDPDEPIWNYTQGLGDQLRDPTGKEVGEYFARIVSWYTKGGFTDELGKRHESGHHYKIDYWEVLNEPDLEHRLTPEQYTTIYDATVTSIRKVAPEMKFVGISVAFPSNDPRMFEYFLNPKNHKPGIPLDMISYHFYASPAEDQPVGSRQYTFFDQADRFLTTARYIEEIRKRLSPSTMTTVNEIGSILPGDPMGKLPIADWYWNLSGATYAYVFGNLAQMGVDIAGESQLVGYPTQFPSVSMVDWETGAPNARFRVLELLKAECKPDNKLVQTRSTNRALYALAMVTPDGARKLLLINKRDRELEVTLPSAAKAMRYVDVTTQGGPIGKRSLSGETMKLGGFAVAVVDL